MHHLYSHTGGDLHGGASKVMAIVCCLVFQMGNLVFTSVFRSDEICFSVCRRPTLVAGARWFL
jgi:hypothetical protein